MKPVKILVIKETTLENLGHKLADKRFEEDLIEIDEREMNDGFYDEDIIMSICAKVVRQNQE